MFPVSDGKTNWETVKITVTGKLIIHTVAKICDFFILKSPLHFWVFVLAEKAS
jgi:hypothetical protein